ncbi:MAG: CHC2 zinc finger domain-containing protein [Actinomycetota bacterium]|nr:CHC2 zinc finger domain-containing protein [Actinomycetota bacterium]
MKAYQRSNPDQPQDYRRERPSVRRAIVAIKERISCIEVADHHAAGKGDGWRRLGADKWTRRCILPGHEDKTPSFVVYQTTDSFYCFACQVGGDVITLEKVCGGHAETWTAVVELSQRYGVPLPKRSRSWYQRQERQKPVREEIRRARAEVLRRRLFKVVMLPLIKNTTSNEREFREEVERAWADFKAVPVRMLLDRYDHLGGV